MTLSEVFLLVSFSAYSFLILYIVHSFCGNLKFKNFDDLYIEGGVAVFGNISASFYILIPCILFNIFYL